MDAGGVNGDRVNVLGQVEGVVDITRARQSHHEA
jgi:hypothetical protein